MFIRLFIVLQILFSVLLSVGCSQKGLHSEYTVKNAVFYKETSKNRRCIFEEEKRKNFNILNNDRSVRWFRTYPSRIQDIRHILDSLDVVNHNADTLVCVRIEPAACFGCPYRYIIKTQSDTIAIAWPYEDIYGNNPLGTYKPMVTTLQTMIDRYCGGNGWCIEWSELFFNTILDWKFSNIMPAIRSNWYYGDQDRFTVMRIILKDNKIMDLGVIENR